MKKQLFNKEEKFSFSAWIGGKPKSGKLHRRFFRLCDSFEKRFLKIIEDGKRETGLKK